VRVRHRNARSDQTGSGREQRPDDPNWRLILVDETGPKPEIKRDQEAFPPELPGDPEALESEKRTVIKSNATYIVALVIIFALVVIYFIAK